MTPTTWPTIDKTALVHGNTLTFRDACPDDAVFVLSLRTDERKSRYLSATSNDLDAQRAWLENYANSAGQAYFIIECDGEAIGTVRFYDARRDSFCWGSWIIRNGGPRQAAMESALMVYAYAIDHLRFKAAHFDVRRGNERVWQFHERFGAKRVGETEHDYLYSLDLPSIQAARKRYMKFLPHGVTVSSF